MACKWVHMKKNRSQWSMSNPAGNVLCYGDAENACSQHASPTAAASSEGLPCRGRTKAACHMGPSGGLTGFVGQKWDQGTQGTQFSSHLLLIFLTCILWAFWIVGVFFPPGGFRVAFSPLEDLEGFFKVYWNSNGISPILVLTYPPWSLGVVLVLSRLTFMLEWGFSLWEIGVLVNAG